MEKLKTMHGILALIDVVNFTTQANRQGEKFTAQYTKYFQEKIKHIVENYNFQVVKTLGDALLVFGTGLEELLDIMLDIFERGKPEDRFGFTSRFRMVAHSGYFQFLVKKDHPVDLVSPEGIKVFRMEKLAETWQLVVTHAVFQGLKPLLSQKHIEASRMPIDQPLKGFDSEEWFPPFYRLRYTPGAQGISNLLEHSTKDLQKNVQSIPVFGNIYPPVPMEENFINLSFQWTDPDSNKFNKINSKLQDKEEAGGNSNNNDEWLQHELSRRSLSNTKQIDVPTLYKKHCQGFIIGLPGAGKTTILRHIAYQEFKTNQNSKSNDNRVVLFVPCRGIPSYEDWYIKRFSEKPGNPDIENSLEYMTWIFLFGSRNNNDLTPEQWVEYQEASKIVQKAFHEQRVTLLVDALDEAPDSKAKEEIVQLFISLVKDTTDDKEPDAKKTAGIGNRFFLTSRLSESIHLENFLFPVFYVLSLNMEQVRAVARHLMREDSSIYQRFDTAIWKEEVVVKMAATPITALLVTAYFQAYEKFHHRYPMYDLLLKFILFKVWDSIKEGTFKKHNLDLLFQEIKKPNLLDKNPDIQVLYDALGALCYELFYETRDGKIHRDVDEDVLKQYFTNFIEDHSPYKKEEDPGPVEQAMQWVEWFHRGHLLLKAGKTNFVFVHSTVMEFLAARHIVFLLSKKQKKIDSIIKACVKSEDFLELETIPIAAGSDLMRAFAILSALKKIESSTFSYDGEYLYEFACKCLVETEWQIEKTLQFNPLESLTKPVLKLITQNKEAVEWLYLYLKELVLSNKKGYLKKKIGQFNSLDAILKLSRKTLFDEYLDFATFDDGDGEIVELRRTLLSHLVQKNILENWLKANQKEKYDIQEFENLWQLDSPVYHPEDKNFRYFHEMIGKELIGFLGSPNMKHHGIIWGCTFSTNGKTFASASSDKTVKLWETSSGREIGVFKGHKDTVNDCVFSPDGKNLFSASNDHTLKKWNVTNGKEIHTFIGHNDCVKSCVISPDGTSILSTSADKTIKQWSSKTLKMEKTLKGHLDVVTSCAFSPVGNTIVSSSTDQTLTLWDIKTGEQIRALSNHHMVMSCTFSPDGLTILSGSRDKTLKIWDAEKGEEMKTLNGHKSSVNACAFSPGGSSVISASSDSTLKLWETETGREIRSLVKHDDAVNDCKFSPDGHLVLSGSSDQTLKLWDVKTGREIRKVSGHRNTVTSCSFSPNEHIILSSSKDQTLRLWDTQQGIEILIIGGHKDVITCCVFSPDGLTFLSASRDNTLKLWDVQSGKEIRTLSGHHSHVCSCCFSPDGKTVLSASKDKSLKLWDVKTGREIRSFIDHEEEVMCCAFSPSQKNILSASMDTTLKLWDTGSGKEVKTLTGHASSVTCCVFTHDGKHFLSASEDTTLKMWETASGKEICTFTGHRERVNSCAFSMDGRYFISTSHDHTIKLWETEKRKLIKSIELPWIPLYAVFSKENKILTANSNGTLTLFQFDELVG